MLRACVIDFIGSWDRHLPLVEFAYNNSFQSSIGMAPYEALYGRKCRTPLCWDEVGERKLVRVELIELTNDKIKVIRERLKVAQDRQKSYADKRRKDLEFEIDDKVFLKVSPWKGVIRFAKRGKLNPRKGKKLICKPCGVPVGIPDNECQSGRRGDCHGPEGGSGS
ncbi:Uncharacterized protein TCM_013479 [Theobroma cacao]|uniref:Reverse transcriptase domain-containing protein n=1 Tax=Theobroma cacao TaxID=3641 RepID=A0A061G3K0_THECC|nr:Uncharacterized protein TCM_013479 [Theobroma cacao]